MTEPSSPFHIGRVFTQTVSVTRRLLPQVLALVVLTTTMHFVISRFGTLWILEATPTPVAYLTPLWSFAYSLMITTCGAGATVILVDRLLNGQRARFGLACAVGLQSIIPLAALRFATWVPVIIGLVLLVAPGLWLAVRWSVAVPARVLEGGGLTNALRRSVHLTKGKRWKLLGIYTLWFGLLGVLSAVASWARVFNANGGFSVAGIDVSLLATASLLPQINNVLTAVLATIVFHQLRHEKDGPLSVTVAEVFA